MPQHEAYRDPQKGDVTTVCTRCGTTAIVQVELNMKLKPGDPLYEDPRKADFGRCRRCKRKQMIVKAVPQVVSTPTFTGFWKLPTDDGSSSDSGT